MLPGERLKTWVDETAMGFKDRARGWMASWLSFGIEVIMDIIGKRASPMLRPFIDKLEETEAIPPELRPLLDELKEPTSEFSALLANSAGSTLVGSAIGTIIDSLLRPILFALSFVPDFKHVDPMQAIALRLRGKIDDESLGIICRGYGMTGKMIRSYLDLAETRLDPANWITAFRRKYEDFSKIEDDLKHQGWSEDRIKALKFVTLYYPSPGELIHWQAREVFEPTMRAKYGLDSEVEELDREPFYKAGLDDKQIDNHWAAHWEHPELRTVVEMLRRTDFTEDDMREWFRLVEIPPFWRQKLIDISYEVPTRVDVRRWWDMRTISEERLREIYEHQGYHGEDLEDYIRWTKVYTDFPMMITRWKNGWITEQDVRDWLAGLEIPAERIDHFIEEKLKADQPERTSKERDITKTDIIKGVKQGVINRGEGVELLVDMGYDEDEAVYILEINIPPDEEDVVVRQRELTKADILKGLKTEVITRDEARTRLLDLRYTPADAEFLLKIFDAQVKPPVEVAGREASKADIISAVKKGLITPEDAYLMLQDIDFTPEAAMFILEVKAEVSPFSPINFAEFKDLTQKYRVAAGMEAKPMPEEIKKAADEVVRLTAEVEALELSITEEKRGLIPEVAIPEEKAKRLKSLQVKRNRAISTLEKAKSEYDRLVAEWRHGLP